MGRSVVQSLDAPTSSVQSILYSVTVLNLIQSQYIGHFYLLELPPSYVYRTLVFFWGPTLLPSGLGSSGRMTLLQSSRSGWVTQTRIGQSFQSGSNPQPSSDSCRGGQVT